MRHLLCAAVIALASSASVAAGADPPSRLDLPDGSTLPLPPGTRAFGPHGPAATSPADAPAPSAAGRETPTDPGERRTKALDELYDRLAAARDGVEATAVGERIVRLQQMSGSDTADLLMQRAVAAMADKDNATALELLDKLIALQPRWAEAWNKRATVRYLNDDDVGSMSDISHVLALQPRHFGALSGMGMILHRNGEDKAAMTVLNQAAALSPQDEQIKTMIKQLKPEVEGTEL